MEKRSVNLLIQKKGQSPLFVKLGIIFPLAAVISLFLFTVFFVVSVVYIANNNKAFGLLKSQVDNLEKQISNKKSIEGIYTLTANRVRTIDQLKSGSKNYTGLLSEILKLQTNGISVTGASIDKKNAVNVSVVASSAATLDDFISLLLTSDQSKLFNDIKGSGIVRDRSGKYLMSISFKPSDRLLR